MSDTPPKRQILTYIHFLPPKKKNWQELAKEFPNSTFTGTDITNVFMASEPRAPSNCTFLEADTLKGLPFDDNTFDFVFQRLNVTCFKQTEWPVVLREMVRVAKPGGYIESSEFFVFCFFGLSAEMSPNCI